MSSSTYNKDHQQHHNRHHLINSLPNDEQQRSGHSDVILASVKQQVRARACAFFNCKHANEVLREQIRLKKNAASGIRTLNCLIAVNAEVVEGASSNNFNRN